MADCFAWFGFILPLEMKEARTFHVPGWPPGLHGRVPVRGTWGRWRELNFMAPAGAWARPLVRPLSASTKELIFEQGAEQAGGAHPNSALALLLLFFWSCIIVTPACRMSP